VDIPLLLFYIGMAYALVLLGYLLGKRNSNTKVGTPSASHNSAMDAIALQKSLFTLFKKYMSSVDSSILVKEVLVVVQQHQ